MTTNGAASWWTGEVAAHSDVAVRRAPHVVATRCGDDVVLLDPRRGAYFTLNHVAGRIWEMLVAPVTVGAVLDALRREFDVAPVDDMQLRQDVLGLLASLSAADLLAERPSDVRHVQ